MYAKLRICATVGGALSETVTTVLLRTVPRLFTCQHCILILVNIRCGWCGWSSAAANTNLTLMSLQASSYFLQCRLAIIISTTVIFPLERPRIGGQSATECRHAVHHTQITRASIPCHSGCVWLLAVVVSIPMPPARRPPTSPTAMTVSGVGGPVAVGGVGGRPLQLTRIWL